MMRVDSHMFDTSDYPENNIFNISRLNKKVIGLMKDECNGLIMTEFVGLKSKMYSYKVDASAIISENEDIYSKESKFKIVKKAKGVVQTVINNTITFEDYIACLNSDLKIVREQCMIRNFNHKLYTIKQKKIALSSFDNKRHILPDGINTLAWGHYSLSE